MASSPDGYAAWLFHRAVSIAHESWKIHDQLRKNADNASSMSTVQQRQIQVPGDALTVDNQGE
jgi:hypothetical protein